MANVVHDASLLSTPLSTLPSTLPSTPPSQQSVPAFVQNWTTPSTLIQTKRFKVRRPLERPDLLLDFPTLFRGFSLPPGATHVVDPFPDAESTAFLRSIAPRMPRWPVAENALLTTPPYAGKWIVAVVPHGTPTDAEGRAVFDKHKENDFYKCFLKSILDEGCAGAWLCLPLAFFLGLNGTSLRLAFLSQYRIVAVSHFHGNLLRYDACSYVAVCFHRSSEPLVEQVVPWTLGSPTSEETRHFPIQKANDWIFCSDLYSLKRNPVLKVTRFFSHTPNPPHTQVTGLVLHAIDGGSLNARIRMRVDPHKQYGSATSKNIATLCVKGRVLSAADQARVAEEWTLLVEQLRQERWGLFLSALDDQTTYSRKRIGYKLAFVLAEHVVSNLLESGAIPSS
jgi:hypothetical protein